MDKDRVDGIGKKVAGSDKEAIGKVTGDTKLEAEGVAQKTAGKAQNAVGGVKDTVRDTVKK
ncbi:MAG: CsbD family protein [Oxalobacteraceae bacterium]|nr:MAG: CsbD family protein [Oxalobacteraceae bacterium]